MSGYIAMARRWQEHDLFEGDEFSRRDAWAWLIANAAWKDGRARVKGAVVELRRGELCYSQRFLAQKWGWSKSRVDRFLALLRDEGMIAARSKIGAEANHPAGHGQSILSICNYDKYQAASQGQRGNNEPPSGATAGQQRGKEEEGKEGKNILPAPKRGKIALPENWEPEPFGEGSEAASIAAGWTDEESGRQLERFKDHHRARGNKFDNWQAAWGTWVRNSVQFARPAPQRHSNGAPDDGFLDRVLAERAKKEAWERRQAAAGGAG
jgi:hypothetical protein